MPAALVGRSRPSAGILHYYLFQIFIFQNFVSNFIFKKVISICFKT